MNRYIVLTKPRIIVLLVITGIVGYLVPSLDDVGVFDLFLFVVLGYASAGGGLAINNIIDREMDEVMERTKSRPSVGPNAMSSKRILFFGTLLSIIGIGGGYLYFGPYTAFFYGWGNLFYLIGYSLYLKKNTVWNTIIGGFASPSPVWAGFAARYEIANGDLTINPDQAFLGVPIEGWLLGGIVFFWSASHTFAMAGKNIEDYTRAQVPMLPVVIGMKKTGLVTLVWGIGVIIYGTWVSFYLTSNTLIVLALFIPHLFLLWGLWTFYSQHTAEAAKKCFMAHNIWLTIVFGTIVMFLWF